MSEANPRPNPGSLPRQLRQHLEALARAGVSMVPGDRTRSQRPGVSVPAPRPASPASRPPEPAAVAMPDSASSLPPQPPASIPRVAASPQSPLFGGASAFDEPPVPPEDRAAVLADLARQVAGCQLCPHLASLRTQTVFGTGSPTARLMFVGEAPGADEDRLGQPFVGRAGQLLTEMITRGMGLKREDVYIANILKCRPPENRTPRDDEAHHCLPYLERQIAVIRPQFLCLLGKTALQYLLHSTLSLGMARGKWHDYRGIRTLVTYHPSYLLRNPASKKDAWQDLQILMRAMDLPIPPRSLRRDQEA